MNPTLSVILPCFNEAEAVVGVIQDWSAQFSQLQTELAIKSLELLVVDDGSTDGGCDNLKASLGPLPFSLRVLRNPKNMGYGQSLKNGIREARGEWLVFHDCDGTCSAADLPRLWALKDKADVVVGQRMGDGTGMPLLRRIGNTLYKTLYKWSFKQTPHDLCSGYRLFHRKWAETFCNELPDQLNFTLAMSLWMTLNGGKVAEAPISYAQRIGDSKLSAWFDGWRFLFTILRYRLVGIRKER